MTPTLEQSAIVDAAKTTQDNLLISALAGAAKTSTLELIAKAITGIPILSLAFNKRIAEEMAARLPSHVNSRTMNSVGHRVWAKTINRKLVVDTRKTYTFMREAVDELKGGDKEEAFELFSDTIKMIGRAKVQGYLPDDKYEGIPRLVTSEEFFLSFEDEPTELQMYLVNKGIVASVKTAYDGQIDYDDQILMPTLFGGDFPRYPLVLIDEAQDLSPLNHEMLSRLVTKRVIAVGDEHQAIYGFRGAEADSMSLLQDRFSMRRMPLSISFRCPIEIVKLARKHAPTMQWPDWAKPGSVRTLAHWTEADIPDKAAIISRNNAPLFKLALDLLRQGRGIKLVGTDLGPQLIKTLKKLGPESMLQPEVLTAIDKWEEKKLVKSRSPGAVSDKADCLRVFASFGQTLSAAIAYAEHLFATDGPIQLLSGHKAKGLEWNNVFHLDPWRIPSKWAKGEKERGQESNIEYVINTRTRENLTFIDLAGMMEKVEEQEEVA